MKNIIVNFELNKGKYDQFHHSFFFLILYKEFYLKFSIWLIILCLIRTNFKKKNLKLLVKNI